MELSLKIMSFALCGQTVSQSEAEAGAKGLSEAAGSGIQSKSSLSVVFKIKQNSIGVLYV